MYITVFNFKSEFTNIVLGISTKFSTRFFSTAFNFFTYCIFYIFFTYKYFYYYCLVLYYYYYLTQVIDWLRKFSFDRLATTSVLLSYLLFVTVVK